MSISSSLRNALWLTALSLLVLVVAAALHAAPASRIVAIGDVHGAGDGFVSILQRSGLVDAQKRWSGGNAILLQTGDLLDRGPDVRQVLDLLMALEQQAAAAGGRVQALLGNHEVLNLIGETRDVAAELYQQFADGRSEARREDAYQAASKSNGGFPLAQTTLMSFPPPRYAEYPGALTPGAP